MDVHTARVNMAMKMRRDSLIRNLVEKIKFREITFTNIFSYNRPRRQSFLTFLFELLSSILKDKRLSQKVVTWQKVCASKILFFELMHKKFEFFISVRNVLTF